MPVPASINDLSTTAGNNSPGGSESPTTTDDYLRALSAFIAQLLAGQSGNYVRANILGTVSQASGVPTGAVIERGSNANGEYVRWADGTQICISPSFTTAITTATGSIFSNQGDVKTWTFPAAFSAVPKVTSLPGTNSTTWGGANAAETTTAASLRVFASGSVASSSVSGYAIGRWF